MTETSPAAVVENLRVAFDGNEVVHGVSLEVRPGECVALVGESGSGKTLTGRSLLGLVPPPGVVSSDRLEIDGTDVRDLSDRQWRTLRGATVGLVSQDALVSLDPLRTVGREVSEALEVQRSRTGPRLNRAEARHAVASELDHVGMPDPANRSRQYAHELSGGLRQRALVAAATITHPKLLIADEPTTALDRNVQVQVLQVLRELKEEGTALLLISHDLAVVATIADRVVVMRNGELVETGATDEVLQAPQHDYTRAMLKALPSAASRGRRLSDQPVLDLPVAEVPDPERVLVEVTSVTQTFRTPDGGRMTAVDDISLTLQAGRTLGVVGESGSGKTTLGRVVLGLQQPDTGEVRLDGEPWSGVPERQRRPRRHLIQAVYQDPLSSFTPRATVIDVLAEALALSGVLRSARRGRSAQLLEWVGLSPDLLDRRPVTMSGGQRQRLAIARALAREPKVLVCDEPVSALDVSVQAQVLDVFSDVQDQLGLAMLFISHDLGVIQHISDDVMVMNKGQVVEQGSADQVLCDPQDPYTRSLLEALPQPGISPDNHADPVPDQADPVPDQEEQQ